MYTSISPLLVVKEASGHVHPSILHPEEAAQILHAGHERVREFAAGRLCAHRALELFNYHDFPLLIGNDRAPLWPDSLIGSITHTRGYAAAMVGSKDHFDGIGIDAEWCDSITQRLWPKLCTKEEVLWISNLPPNLQSSSASLLFSAKEAFFKCQYGITRHVFDFCDVSVSITPRFFIIHPKTNIGQELEKIQTLKGEYKFNEGMITTTVVFHRTQYITKAPNGLEKVNLKGAS